MNGKELRVKKKKNPKLNSRVRSFPVAPDKARVRLSIFLSCSVPQEADRQGFSNISLVLSLPLGFLVRERHREETTEQENWDGTFIPPAPSLQEHHRFAVSPPRGHGPSWVALYVPVVTPSPCPAVVGPRLLHQPSLVTYSRPTPLYRVPV